MVVVFHLGEQGVSLGPLDLVSHGLNSGVFVFFALSGYLLYRPFVVGSVDLPAYAIKRAARILPGYYFAVVGLSVLTGSTAATGHALEFATLTQTFDPALFHGFVAPAWTLTVEVSFYFALPVLARCGDRGPRLLPWLGIASLAGGLATGLLIGASGPIPSLPPFLFFGFVPGMLIAAAEHRNAAAFVRLGARRFMAIGIALLIVAAMMRLGNYDAVTPIGAALLIPGLSRLRLPNPAIWTFLGGASYAVYLWHWDLLQSLGPLSGLLFTAGIAAASWLALERPILVWAHRIARSAPSGLQSSSSRKMA